MNGQNAQRSHLGTTRVISTIVWNLWWCRAQALAFMFRAIIRCVQYYSDALFLLSQGARCGLCSGLHDTWSFRSCAWKRSTRHWLSAGKHSLVWNVGSTNWQSCDIFMRKFWYRGTRKILRFGFQYNFVSECSSSYLYSPRLVGNSKNSQESRGRGWFSNYRTCIEERKTWLGARLTKRWRLVEGFSFCKKNKWISKSYLWSETSSLFL